MGKKTDNSNLDSKLFLRRYFLDKYHPDNVIDCCQGSRVIWNLLSAEYQCKYLGVDIKPKKGRLRVNSLKLLSSQNLPFDVFDVDTYGSPWAHWEKILQNRRSSATVFLTFGQVRIGGGTLDKKLIQALGLSSITDIAPKSLLASLSDYAVPYLIRTAENYGFEIVDCKESTRSKNARYIGVRIEK